MRKFLPLFLFIGFSFFALDTLRAQSFPTYDEEIEQWYRQRIHELKKESGWLNLAGLFWLDEGIHSFGSDAGHPIVFPKGSVPSNAGYFERRKDSVMVTCAAGVSILLNGRLFERAVVYSAMMTDTAVMRYGSWMWTIIRREDRIGIRLRDLAHPQSIHFSGIDRFSVQKDWVVEASLVPSGQRPTVSITNVLGQTSEQRSPGKVKFSIAGSSYTLDALQEGEELFILFSDATNGESTYPSGRFLYAKMPDANGKTVLDFNKAINPPCAFTPYATCPLPPPQNHLPIAVTAGEKVYHLK